MKIKLFTFFLLFCLFTPEKLKALQVYRLVDQRRTQASISRKHHTRIAVEEDRIAQLFGAEDVFDIQTDEAQGQIFLKLLNPERQDAIPLTIVTEGGLTQDLHLIPRDMEAQSILFKPGKLMAEEAPIQKDYTSEIADLMEQMMQRQSIPGYEREVLRSLDRTVDKAISLEPSLLYKGSLYEGRLYRVQNRTKLPLTLTEKRFLRQGDVAISLSREKLGVGQMAWVYILSKRGGRP